MINIKKHNITWCFTTTHLHKHNINIKNKNQQQSKMEYLAYGKVIFRLLHTVPWINLITITPFNLGYFTNYKTRMKNGPFSECYVNGVILTECVCCGSIYYRLCRGGPTRCLWTGMASPAASPSTRSWGSSTSRSLPKLLSNPFR